MSNIQTTGNVIDFDDAKATIQISIDGVNSLIHIPTSFFNFNLHQNMPLQINLSFKIAHKPEITDEHINMISKLNKK